MTSPYFPRYLQRSLDSGSYKEGADESVRSQAKEQRVSQGAVLAGLPGAKLTIVLGEAGAGKSTLIRSWAKALARQRLKPDWHDQEPPLPLLTQGGRVDLELSRMPWALLSGAQPTLPRAFLKRLQTQEGLRFQPNCILFVDALDELAQDRREAFVRSLLDFPFPVVLTCRDQVWHERLGLLFREAGLPVQVPYTVAPLTAYEQLNFLKRWPDISEAGALELHQRIRAHPQLSALASNVLMLTLMARLAHHRGLDLPVTRAKFYSLALDDQWQRKLNGWEINGHPVPENVIDILAIARDQYLPALSLHVASSSGVTAPITAAHLQSTADHLRLEQGHFERLLSALQKTGILTRQGTVAGIAYGFQHQTFREFALASALLTASDQQQLLHRLLELVQQRWDQRDDQQMVALALAIATQEGVSPLLPMTWLIDQGRRLSRLQRYQRKVSPLRRSLHLLRNSGVQLDGTLLKILVGEIVDHRWREVAVAADPLTPPEVLRALTQSDNLRVLLQLALNKSLPSDCFSAPALWEQNNARTLLAKNPSAPPEVLEALVGDEQVDVRLGVAGNPSTSLALLERLLNDPDVHVIRGGASNPRLPEELLAELAQSKDYRVRAAVAGNSSSPAVTLQLLSSDQSATVRRAVAGNEHTPPEALRILSTDSKSSVLADLGKNAATDHSMLMNLLSSGDVEVKAGLARNSNLGGVELMELLEGNHPEVCRALAGNPNINRATFDRLLSMEMSSITRRLARNPALPRDIASRLSEVEDFSVRMGLARNPAIETDVLEKLTENYDSRIMYGIALNSNIHLEGLCGKNDDE